MLLILALAVITASAIIALSQTNPAPVKKSQIDTAVNQAKLLYNSEKQRGRDFSNGPCLSNALMPGWVVDIAHNPRQEIDNLVENQCAAFVEGSAQHFVELDINGNLIRAK